MRDLIYLDFDKAASIWSQFRGGLRNQISVTDEEAEDKKTGVKLGIPSFVDARFGADYKEKRSTMETRVLHHDLLNEVEEELKQAELVADLLSVRPDEPVSADTIRAEIGNRPYLSVHGRSVIEDYRRIQSIAERFNDIVQFISWCSLQGVRQSPEYAELQRQIAAAKNSVAQIKDRNQQAVHKAKIKSLEAGLAVLNTPQMEGVDQELLDGIKNWIETFMPNRINLRIFPYETCPSFQVICNLKRECFVDQNLEHLLYGYGVKPNVPLAVFGLVTSLPPAIPDTFDPLAEFKVIEATEKTQFERAFRSIFTAMDDMESFVRYSRYPNVTVHPIAVYRSFGSS